MMMCNQSYTSQLHKLPTCILSVHLALNDVFCLHVYTRDLRSF